MARLDARAAWLLVIALGLTALIGFGQGLAQALKAPRPEQVAAGVDPSRDPVPATALTGPALDEARVREIAREEAAAALGATRKKAAPAPKDDDDSADDAAPARPSTADAPASAPAPATPPAATATPPSTPG